MKNKLLTAALLIVLLALPAFAVGTNVPTIAQNQNGYVLTFTWTADASDGSVPNATTSAADSLVFKGLFLSYVETNPGAVAPTDNYDITILNAGGADLMATALANRDTSNTEFAFPPTVSPQVDTALTLTLSGNSVNSAVGTVKLYFTRSPTAGTISGLATDSAEGAAGTENYVGVGGIYRATQVAQDDGDKTKAQTDSFGNFRVQAPSAALPVFGSQVANATGGASTAAILSAASDNATSVKASAGKIYGIELINTTSAIYFFKLYNLAAAPTCTSATGFVRSIPIPHGSGAGGGIFSTRIDVGADFTTGFAYCICGGTGASTDGTSAATGIFGAAFYK